MSKHTVKLKTEYKIVIGADALSLSEQVTEHLNDEWELYGSPYSSELYGSPYSCAVHCQAMIKHTAPPPVRGLPR